MQPRWYQAEAVNALFDYFRANSGVDETGQPRKANPVIALPTGTGKSLVIADFIKQAMFQHPNTRVIMGTHVKELISQNAGKMLEAWPLAPLGVYSAGLKSRDVVQPIIFGGIQSMVKHVNSFGRRDLLVIDEAHLVGEEGNYIKFIGELQATNPWLKVILLTATPYRAGLGLLTNGNIATDIVYNLCTPAGFTRLIAEGFLAPLIPRRTKIEIDLNGVGIRNGEFVPGQLERAADRITYEALSELVAAGQDRRSWLIFASGINHAQHISEMLNSAFGIPTVAVHSANSDAVNAEGLRAWKAGEVRAAVNMNALTTGVDHPACDLIGMLRPTMSTGLWVQMLGRGTRPCQGKENCLVLDYAGNTRRLGPIDNPVIPRPKSEGPPGDAPVKICPACSCYNNASARKCFFCGTEFISTPGIVGMAGTEELLSTLPQMEWFNVKSQIIVSHISKTSGKRSLKVSYFTGLRTFSEFISLESDNNFFRKISRDWFRQRYGEPWDGITNDQVLALTPQLRTPKQIKVWINIPKPEIKGYEF